MRDVVLLVSISKLFSSARENWLTLLKILSSTVIASYIYRESSRGSLFVVGHQVNCLLKYYLDLQNYTYF